VRLAGLRVDLVPPAQPDQAAAGDVLQVVEVDREQEDGDDEDEDAARRISPATGARRGQQEDLQVPREEDPEEVD
jgi:hypothetical protein